MPFQSPEDGLTERCSGRTPTVLALAFAKTRAVDKIHLRRADEAGYEFVGRIVVKLHRRADLLDPAGVQHHDLVGERHRLDLIMRDIDHRRLQPPVKLGDFQPRIDAQRRVEIGQRFVEQEQFRFAHDRPADGDALALAARKLGGTALQIGFERQHGRGDADALVDLRRRRACLLQPKPHIVAHGEMRIERVGLEHHGDAALGRRRVDDVDAIDQHLAGGRILQPGDDAQQGGLAAAGRPDENDELAVVHVEVDALQHIDLAEGFRYILDLEGAQGEVPFLRV